MKEQIKSLLLVAIVCTMALPALAQTSTQGKEFWVSLVPSQYAEADKASAQKASDSDNKFKPYIAISAQKACTVEISNPRTGWSYSVSVNANEWKEVGKNGEIPIAQWYTPDQMPTSEKAYDMGLKVESSEDVSVYCSLRWGFSADATNILPINALQSEYIVQTYEAIKQNITFDGSSADQPKTEDNDFNGVQKNSFTILAAEDCVVDVTLSASTSGGKSGQISGIQLSQGQVYHVLSAVNESLSGSRVVARDGKKIAVFAGAPSTRLPNAFSDRDLLYEQLFPVDYWGQNFIIVRSKQKDANRIIITAQVDGTQVTIHGQYDPSTSKFEDHTIQKDYTFTLNAGKSYEFEMSAGYEDERWHKKRSAFKGITVIDTAAFISTSCPCAVVSYDVGNKYVREDESEVYNDGSNNYGAPAMTWIAPIEQMLNDVVFGVMGSDKVTRHFANIVIEKRDLPYVKLNGASLESSFREVPSNKDYCYARLTLDETDPGERTPNPFYHLESKYGFIATVYGNGHNESYAYTAGSSAVKRAISVDGIKFTDDMEVDDITLQTYCVNSVLRFDPQVGTDVIDKVEWDFDDGTTATTTKEDEIAIDHFYATPGWYKISALVYAHKECPDTVYPAEAVQFKIRVVRPDTVYVEPVHVCKTKEEIEAIAQEYDIPFDDLIANGLKTRLNPPTDPCYVTKEFSLVFYGYPTSFEKDTVERDSAFINGRWWYPEDMDADGKKDIEWTIEKGNHLKCDSNITYHLKLISCLKMNISNTPIELHTCQGNQLQVPYSIEKGVIDGDAILTIDELGMVQNVQIWNVDKDTLLLPTEAIEHPGFYHGKLTIKDYNCPDQIHEFPFEFAVYYPSGIFERKFNNVLAVYQQGGNHNKSYNFVGYQWYYRADENTDAAPIAGATGSIYYTGEQLLSTGWYSVELTDANKNLTIRSCEQFIDRAQLPDYNPKKSTAQKKLINKRIYIVVDGRTYNAYGQRVE